MKRGRVEWQLTLSAPLTADATDSTGPFSISVGTAGDTYYPTDLIAAVAMALEGATLQTWTVSLSGGESGTGLVTIASSSTYSLTFTSTALRDALGFAGNIASTSSPSTGTKCAKGVWLPHDHKITRYGDGKPGWLEADLRAMITAGGHVSTVGGLSRRINSVKWPGVPAAYVLEAFEVTEGSSFERVYRDCMLGEFTLGRAGAPIRLYWDADEASYSEYKIVGRLLDEFSPEPTLAPLTHLFAVELDRLVEVPA